MHEYDDLKITVTIECKGKKLQLNNVNAMVDLQDFIPFKGPIDPYSMNLYHENREKRQRFIDMISSSLAHSVMEAIYKLVK